MGKIHTVINLFTVVKIKKQIKILFPHWSDYFLPDTGPTQIPLM